MLVWQSTPSWHDHLRMKITNDLATIDAAPILSLSWQPRQTVVLQALKRMLGAHSPAIIEHGERTASYALDLGNKIGLSGEELVNLATLPCCMTSVCSASLRKFLRRMAR